MKSLGQIQLNKINPSEKYIVIHTVKFPMEEPETEVSVETGEEIMDTFMEAYEDLDELFGDELFEEIEFHLTNSPEQISIYLMP